MSRAYRTSFMSVEPVRFEPMRQRWAADDSLIKDVPRGAREKEPNLMQGRVSWITNWDGAVHTLEQHKWRQGLPSKRKIGIGGHMPL
ncbi:hypothetical protein Avbf_14544 [Armadillidium vulgare]|nr:hypothetical protein Avbf_14544 [Armadillidium vulgare]